MRIAVIGAFPFPVPQGSQVFVTEQLRALRAAGVFPTLFCYGTGAGPAPGDVDLVRVPRWLSPRRLRAGLSVAKPGADLALLRAVVNADRSNPFQVALAHNAEAALLARAARGLTGLPFVYVAHTLWGEEFFAYGPPALESGLAALGRRLDASLAGAADAVIALAPRAASWLGAAARGPVEVIPPGLQPGAAPSAAEVGDTCRKHGLSVEGFVLYAGNLDRYQDLDRLGEIGRRIAPAPLVLATHEKGSSPVAGARLVRVQDAKEARRLTWGARVAVLPRHRPGGFPIKLLNYMEAGRAIVAHAHVAESLEHQRSAWLLPPTPHASAFAEAVETLWKDETLRRKLGASAREQLEAQHSWPVLAQRTVELARRVGRQSEAAPRILLDERH